MERVESSCDDRLESCLSSVGKKGFYLKIEYLAIELFGTGTATKVVLRSFGMANNLPYVNLLHWSRRYVI
jgi:hypothetical protein